MSDRLHSRYERTLADLPWQGRPVSLRVEARRFRCANPGCTRRTFAERLPEVVPVAGRRTARLGDLQRCVALALGGEAGARLAERFGMATSADTLLRLAVAPAGAHPAARSAPRVLGVDDWAWRRGHRYGTVLVDLERNAVVDLLPDRSADTLAAWLRGHGGVEVVARDRAGAYADGARQGAPAAQQVADRWHLLRNLGAAVEALADRHAKAAGSAAAAIYVPPAEMPPRPPTRAERASEASLARRQARYEEAARLAANGVSLRRIAVLLGAERKTVRGWLRRGHAPLWQQPKGPSMLDPHRDYLEQRWREGCSNAAQLWRELVTRGFGGRPSTVRAWAGARRDAPSVTGPSGAGRATQRWQLPSRRGLARLLMAEPATLADVEQTFIRVLLSAVPDLAKALAIAKRLRSVLLREADEDVDAVLAEAEATSLAGSATSMRRDIDAIRAALSSPWTTSPVEGQINRLKTIKRSMYGRAGFALLRARVLHAA